jgi:hypothetical protein
MLKSPFDYFASEIDDACEPYIAIKLDDFVAEIGLHSHVWLLLFGI